MGKNYRSDILFVVAVGLLLWAAYTVRDVLLLIYVSALFAVVVSPAIQLIRRIRIRRWRPGRGFAITVLMLTLGLALTVFLVVALPPIYYNAREFASDPGLQLFQKADFIFRRKPDQYRDAIAKKNSDAGLANPNRERDC